MLAEVAAQLRDANEKVQLIYAFNGVGKTRLSRAFKELVASSSDGAAAGDDTDGPMLPREKILYYNAFTEDLFYWDNDLRADAEPKLMIQPNTFTDWILQEQGQDQNIVTNFQHYVGERLTPRFNEERVATDEAGRKTTVRAFSEVTFTLASGDDEHSGALKISKGEESNFIWSVFYTLLDQVIEALNVAEPQERDTAQFDLLEYVFIDDPVSSLDENHLIELAVDLAALVKKSNGLKFVITTHNPLFYNVLYNELNKPRSYLLTRQEDGGYVLCEKRGDSNSSFSYHLDLKGAIEQAIADGEVRRYHFTLLRNLYEKTASFLGYQKWSALLPDDKQVYLSRVMNFTSHSTLSNEAVAQPTDQEQQTVRFLLDHLINTYGYWQPEETAHE